MYNFKDIDVPQEQAAGAEYLKPGKYLVDRLEGKMVEEAGKTPYYQLTVFRVFGGVERQATGKFYLTTNTRTLERIQYLYTMLTTKKLTSEFSAKDLGLHFERVIKAYNEGKLGKKGIIISGDIAESGKVFGNFPFSKFILEPDEFTEAEFVEGSSDWAFYVRPTKSLAPRTDDTIVAPASATEVAKPEPVEPIKDDLPF